mmetsp:Transcript_52979/g.140617  ORF Transcript_52979/g.140617 Transcript_52979/m.140617 type:complete len:231 (-) Transcript_52979:292-984(-)
MADTASSLEMSAALLSANLVIADCNFWTASSTPEIFSLEACIWDFRFLSAVSFFDSASLAASPSSLFWSASSCFVQVSEGPSENCLTSASFSTMNLRVSAIDFWAEDAEASHMPMATRASLGDMVSMPFRKGSSASAVFWTSDLTLSTFSTACAKRSDANDFSFCTFEAAINSPNLVSAFVIRDRMACNSAFKTPCALLSFTSTSFAVVVTLVFAETVAFSMRSTASGEG